MNRDRDFWRRNYFNESIYTHARLDVRRSIAGKQKTLVNVGSHLCAEAKPYLQDGWRVFAFEPNPNLASQLREMERENPDFTFIPKAVSNEAEANVDFFVSEVASGISSLFQRDPASKPIPVEVTTLADFCKEYSVDTIDYLLIDAELKDLEVFLSLEPHIRLGAVTIEFGAKRLPAIHSNVIARNPEFEEIVFEYRKPLGADGKEMMGVAAKCLARSSYEEYMKKLAAGTQSGTWGNILYYDPAL